MHCPRYSLNLAGSAPPGHRNGSGSTWGTVLCQCPKVASISYAGVRRRKPMLRLRPTRWSRSGPRTNHWRGLVRMSGPKNWPRVAGSRIATARCFWSLPGEGLPSAEGMYTWHSLQRILPGLALLTAPFPPLANARHPLAGSWVRAGKKLRNRLGWSREERER